MTDSPMAGFWEKRFTKTEMDAIRRAARAEDAPLAGFWEKFKRFGARLPFAEDLLAAYYCLSDSATPYRVRAILAGALLYFIMPIDAVPDVVPLLGFADDAAMLAAAIAQVSGSITETHRQKAKDTLRNQTGSVA